MQQVRPPVVAGSFYPAEAAALEAELGALMADSAVDPATRSAVDAPPPKALVVPHAGYIYSGAVAARAYAQLAGGRGTIRRVLLLGPAHRVAFPGFAASGAEAFATPLGEVPVDAELRRRALRIEGVELHDDAHRSEHCLEVQLPFLQRALGSFSLLPLLVGNSTAPQAAALLRALWGGEETLIVISSDLSHYLEYRSAQRRDAATCAAIEALDAAAIGFDDACGRLPLAGLLLAAKRYGLHAETLDLRNSGDTAGARARVVGYGAWAFREDVGDASGEGHAH